MSAIHVRAMQGMGDGVYARPAIKRLVEVFDEVHIETCWPELYADLPRDRLRLHRGSTTFLVQANARDRASAELWSERPIPEGLRTVQLGYNVSALRDGRTPAAEQWARVLPDEPYRPAPLDLPEPYLMERLVADWPPYVRFGLVRYPVCRPEYDNSARDPDPQAIFDAKAAWPRGIIPYLAAPPAPERWRGHVPIGAEWKAKNTAGILLWCARADRVVSGPCFLPVVAAAYGRQVVCCFGGHLPSHGLVNQDEQPTVTVIETKGYACAS